MQLQRRVEFLVRRARLTCGHDGVDRRNQRFFAAAQQLRRAILDRLDALRQLSSSENL
jgi:hypothetical protein